MKSTPTAAPQPAPSPATGPRLFGRARSIEGEREIPVGPATRPREDAAMALPTTPAVDLGDGPKALFVMGPGRSAKRPTANPGMLCMPKTSCTPKRSMRAAANGAVRP